MTRTRLQYALSALSIAIALLINAIFVGNHLPMLSANRTAGGPSASGELGGQTSQNPRFEAQDWHERGMEAHERLDYPAAIGWYRKAADAGYAPAQNDLGRLHERGLGVDKDYEQAARWYRLAADQGYADAQFRLGALYQLGRGVSRDMAQAVAWFRRAANQGDILAQARLGVLFAEGLGGSQRDRVQAFFWATLAAASGDGKSAALSDSLERQLPRQQLAQARRMLTEWRPQEGYQGR